MPHKSLAPHFETARELYEHLQRDQKHDEFWINVKLTVLVAALWLALLGGDAWRYLGIFFSVMTGISAVWTITELVNRNWFMHRLTLAHLMKGDQEGHG